MPVILVPTDLPCPLWRRLLALVYDLLIVVAIVMVVGLLCQLATDGQLVGTAHGVEVPAWYQLLQWLVVSAYFLSSWRRGGQTVGMRPWRIRLTSADGSTPSWRQLVVRLFVAEMPMLVLVLAPQIGLHQVLWVLLLVWIGWLLPAIFDRRRRALHDLVAGTEIRQLR